MHQRVHSILLGKCQPRVLVEPSTVLIGHTIAILDVQRDYANFVDVPCVWYQFQRVTVGSGRSNTTHATSLLSNRGTISSTSDLGTLPSEFKPVEQHCSTLAMRGSLSFSKMAIQSWAILRCSENWEDRLVNRRPHVFQQWFVTHRFSLLLILG